MKKKTTDKNSLDQLIEEMQKPDIDQCAVIMLTKSGGLMIGSHNIEEVDVIDLFQKTADFMIDQGGLSISSRTLH